jgi:xylan 1,4-beta-xylosidase
VRIDVDATAASTPLERVWAYFGYDEVNYTTTREGEALLHALARSNTAKVHVRTHFLFNTGDGTPALKWGSTNIYSEGPNGEPSYDYTLIDRIMDATVQAGVSPLFELGFMPQALSTQPTPYEPSGTYILDSGSFYPPRDYDAWAALVSAWAARVKQRYPDAEESWLWELWNEPDIAYWKGTFEEYARLYDVSEAALHAVMPAALLGGPAVASPDTGFLRRFLEHCATGTNTVSGRTGTRLDFVTFHAKGGVGSTDEHVQMDLGNQLRLHRSGFEAVSSSAFARTPVIISEADPDGCAACPGTQRPENAYRTSPAYGAYEVAMMKRSLDLALEMGIDLRGILTWAFTFPGSAYFAGYRELATNGIHLPVFNAFKLLGSLSGGRLPLRSSGARPLAELLESGVRDEPDVDGLAAIDGHRIRILVWNYHDDLTGAADVPVTLEVAVPPGFREHTVVTHTRVDDLHGDAFSVWVSQGKPARPSASEEAALRAAMEPVVLEQDRVVDAASGEVSLSFELPRFGLSLVTLETTPAPAPGPATPRARDAGCSCRAAAPARTGSAPLAALALAAFAMIGRRVSSRRAASNPTSAS